MHNLPMRYVRTSMERTNQQQLLAGLQELKAVHDRHQDVLNTYKDLETTLRELQGTLSSLQTHISVGGGVMMQAEVPDTSRVFVDVGLGFKVECSKEDGLRIAGLRQAAAQEQMNACAMEAAKIQTAFKG
ncbi:probable protein UXT homolog [Coccomyxa sp. Obi]|nr:probable protein UXT homolog [Coccomyxa sp. Obi]